MFVSWIQQYGIYFCFRQYKLSSSVASANLIYFTKTECAKTFTSKLQSLLKVTTSSAKYLDVTRKVDSDLKK